VRYEIGERERRGEDEVGSALYIFNF